MKTGFLSKSKGINFYNKNWANMAYLKSQSVATAGSHTWICTQDNKLFKEKGFNHIVSGTKPTTCDKIATNNNGNLYVIDKSKVLFHLFKLADGNYRWEKVSNDIISVSVGSNDHAMVLKKDGFIYFLEGSAIGDKFNTKEFKDAKSIVVSKDLTNPVVYLIDKSSKIQKVLKGDDKKISHVFESLSAKNMCISSKGTVFILSGNGVYMKRPNVLKESLVADGIGSSIDCSEKLWIVSDDSYIYNAEIN